jgi:putative membrane-bound dehydrogenase-like protein
VNELNQRPDDCLRLADRTTCAKPQAWLGAVVLLGVVSLVRADDLKNQLPRIPPTAPQDAVRAFTIQRGFSVELVASEPDVVDPIDAAFDEDGRMYVVQMCDYPFLPEQRAPKYISQRPETWGSIQLLEDTDGDGRMDQSVVFADKLRWPQSVCCYKGGVFVISPPSLWYLKDTDGDGVADLKEEILTGFDLSNVQGLANGLEWSLDHGIYFPGGRTGAELKQADKTAFKLGRRDLRLDPATRTFTPVSGGEQFGHTFDDWGNRFVCNNSNHLEQIVYPLRYIERNPQLAFSAFIRTIAKEGAAAPVYRISPPEPWRVVRTARRAADPAYRNRLPATELVVTGFFTSATGVTVYRGGAYPPEFQGNVFIGDVGGNLVHRKRLVAAENSVSLVGERTEEHVEFLASTDNWFRPVNFVNAPDGTLYILDMYRETIEHPASIPDDIKEHVDLESGYDRGRIYRLVSPGMLRFKPPKMNGLSTAELVAQLASPHGWVRDTAHRLIWERQDSAAAAPLRELLASVEASARRVPQARIHALWSLDGLQQLQIDDVLAGLRDADPRVREHALQLAERCADRTDAILPELLKLAGDHDLRVRWQLAFTLGEFRGPEVVQTLQRLAKDAGTHADLQTAVLSSIGPAMVPFTLALLQDPATTFAPITQRSIAMIGSMPDPSAAAQLFNGLLATPVSPKLQDAGLTSLAEGLRLRGRNLTEVAAHVSVGDAARTVWETKLQAARQISVDPAAPVKGRTLMIQLIAATTPAFAADAFVPLLEPQADPVVQTAAVAALARFDDSYTAGLLIRKWKGLGPASRKEALDGLTRTKQGATVVLAALAEGTLKSADLDRDRQQFLMNHPQSSLRAQAKKLLGEGTSTRREVVSKYQSALSLPGDSERGRKVYAKICFQCHRAGTEGHLVGPDLVSVQNKSPEDLLIAILDPNREAQPIYTNYTASTLQGQVHTGIIAAETASNVTLRRAEAKEDVVLRDQIEELVSTGQSLMPEGMEKDLSPEQIADVLAFIKALAPPGK